MARKNTGTYADAIDNISYADHINNADQIYLTNSSGVQLTTGDVGVMEVSADKSMTTTTTVGDLRPVVVVPAAITGQDVSASKNIAAAAQDWFFKAGAYVPAANVDGAVTRGDYLKFSATAKKLTTTGVQFGSATPIPVGACAIALETIGVAGTIAVRLMETHMGIAGLAYSTTAPKDRQLLFWDAANSKWEVGGSAKYYAPYKTQASSVAEVTVFSKTIEGGSVGANGAICVKFRINIKNAEGTANGLTIKVKLGGTQLYSSGSNVAHSAIATNRAMINGEARIRCANSQAAQISQLRLASIANDTADTGNAITVDSIWHSTSAIDVSTDKTLEVTATMDTSHADFSWELVEGTIEVQYAA